MQLITCSRCNSQFDTSTMAAGSSFVCGQCRNVLQVPAAQQVVQPTRPGQPRRGGHVEPPPTVQLTPDQVQRALRESASLGAAPSAPAQPQRKLPKAMQKRQQRGAGGAPSAQRAGRGGGPAPSNAPETKLSRKPTKRRAAAASGGKKNSAGKKAASGSRRAAPAADAGPPPKKNQAPLFIGIGVAVVAIALAIMATRGDDPAPVTDGNGGTDTAGVTDGTTPAGTDPAGGNTATAGGDTATAGGDGATPAPMDGTAAFLALTSSEQKDEITGWIQAAIGSPDQLKTLADKLNTDRMQASPAREWGLRQIADAALKVDSSLVWAREAKGERNGFDLIDACIGECVFAFEYPEDDENMLKEKQLDLEESPWIPKAEYDTLAAAVERVRTRNGTLKDDPRMVQFEKAIDWIRKNDLFKDLNIVPLRRDPYIIFQEYPLHEEGMEHHNKDRIAKANLLAKRDGVIFNELNRRYRELFAERYNLPELHEKNRICKVLILWNRETFDEWHRRQETGIPGLIRAYYSPKEKHIVHYVGDDALRGQDIYPIEGGRIQKQSDQVTFHEGTHQLQHEYGAIVRGSPLTDNTEDPVPPRRSMWFDEGMAEFMGAVEIDEDKVKTLEDVVFYHNRVLLERVQLARNLRRQQAPLWPMSKLILPNHNGEMMQMGEEIMPGRGGLAVNLFYAQAWGFIHFSYYYDNGKYRDNLFDYYERVLNEEHGPDALAKAYNLPSKEDFGIIDKEFEWYWNLLLRTKVGKMRGKEEMWITPNTDPPEGRYDPDDEGGGDYDE